MNLIIRYNIFYTSDACNVRDSFMYIMLLRNANNIYIIFFITIIERLFILLYLYEQEIIINRSMLI